MILICGIDEAGRGPVIGPMVIAGVILEEDKIQELTSLGVKDSKLLLHERREFLFKHIKKLCINYSIIKIEPKEIDEALNSTNMNLNLLELQSMVKIIDTITPAPNIVIVDCPSVNTYKYGMDIQRICKRSIEEVIAEHKADVNYPIVSAASILAKVIRDEEIEKLKNQYNIDFGSGYPSDPKTRKFLTENFSNPEYSTIFRKTWKTYKELLCG